MSFSFGFSGDDIDEDAHPSFASSTQNDESMLSSDDYKTMFMTTTNLNFDPEYVPRKLTLEELLAKSIGVRMSYTSTAIKTGEIISRRDLYDVKHQLMTQDTLSTTDEILLGLTNEDLRVATYEGGLKSWECTFDLMEVLAKTDLAGFKSVLELGCGTGLPSTLLLQKFLQAQRYDEPRKLVLADYNESVLRLVTVPNLLFTWCELQSPEMLAQLQTSTGNTMELRSNEIEVTENLVATFLTDLASKNITLEFVSGGWSPQFVSVLSADKFDLVLASETIYSPETLPIFTDTMLCLMNERTESLVAAKRVYFGVGGGIPEFERALDVRNINYQTISEETSQGVVRAILRVAL